MAEKTLMQKFEKLHLGMKFALIGGSAYLMIRKWNQMKAEDLAAASVALQQTQPTGFPGATRPLVEATAIPLPLSTDVALQYGGASPDQLSTTRALPMVQQTALTPNALATSGINAGAAYLQSLLPAS